MNKLYLFLVSVLMVSTLPLYGVNDPGQDSNDVQNVDIQYDFDIEAYILEFPDFNNYKAILFKGAEKWEYKLFFKDGMIEHRFEQDEALVESENDKKSNDAIALIFKDINRHEKILKAISKNIHNKK